MSLQTTAPKVIFLQTGLNAQEASETDFAHLSEVQWSSHQVDDGDLRYVLLKPGIDDLESAAVAIAERVHIETADTLAGALKQGIAAGMFIAAAQWLYETGNDSNGSAKAISEALKIIDEREAEIERLKIIKNDGADFFLWLILEGIIKIPMDGDPRRGLTPNQMYDLFRKETGRA